MQMIIEARLVDDVQETTPVRLAVVDRELTTSTLGLTMAEGKALLASAQQYLVRAQCAGSAAAHSHCEICNAKLGVKGWHERRVRTVFGRVKVRSPRVRCCVRGQACRSVVQPVDRRGKQKCRHPGDGFSMS